MHRLSVRVDRNDPPPEVPVRGKKVRAPRGWRWLLLTITSPSGKNLFACNRCGGVTPGPVKWEYHECHPERQGVARPASRPRRARGGK